MRHKLLCVCSLYNNTRDLSANAVAAGQAYQNIVKFISAAHNNSVEAVEDAERALNEVGLESSDVWQGKEKERVQGSLPRLRPFCSLPVSLVFCCSPGSELVGLGEALARAHHAMDNEDVC